MKKGSTIFLKAVIYLMGLVVLLVYGLLLREFIKNQVNPTYAPMLYPLLAIMGLSVIPFLAALVQGLKLLRYIDQSRAFSMRSVMALKTIKRCALMITILYVPSLPFFYQLAEKDDAPGLIIIGLLFVGAPVMIATFAAVLEKLLKQGIELKTENELTI